jgi:hypothetical protein
MDAEPCVVACCAAVSAAVAVALPDRPAYALPLRLVQLGRLDPERFGLVAWVMALRQRRRPLRPRFLLVMVPRIVQVVEG